MLPTFIRFSDLKARGIIKSRAQLHYLQKKSGFPLGRLIGVNSRAWTEDEIAAWLETLPTSHPEPEKFRKMAEKRVAARDAKAAA